MHDDMAGSDHETIQIRAYEIWEHEGRPEGKHKEHWEQAQKELDASSEVSEEPATTGAETTVGARD